MQGLEFEWDEHKSNQVYEERGFDFGFAAQAFFDPQASISSVAELAVALQLSPSTIRRWRRGAASPTAANLRRLRERLGLRS